MTLEKIIYAAGVILVVCALWYFVRPLNAEEDERDSKLNRAQRWKQYVDNWWNRQY
jgi:hypothetical protein